MMIQSRDDRKKSREITKQSAHSPLNFDRLNNKKTTAANHNDKKDSFLGAYIHNQSLDEPHHHQKGEPIPVPYKGSAAAEFGHVGLSAAGGVSKKMNKHDFSQRLSSLAIVDQNNMSISEEMQASELESTLTCTSKQHKGEAFDQKFRDESDESKATTQQSAAERRKVKRETLANYLKTSERPAQAKPKLHTSSTHVHSLGRNHNINQRSTTQGGEDGAGGIQRHSSKTSMHSNQSTTKKRRSGTGIGGTSSTPKKYTPSSAGKTIRRLGGPSHKVQTVSTSIEMVRTGGIKVTTAHGRNNKEIISNYDSLPQKSSQSPMMQRNEDSQAARFYIENERKSAPSHSSEKGDKADDETPRQMQLGVFQSKNSSIVYDADSQKIITTSQVFKRSNNNNGNNPQQQISQDTGNNGNAQVALAAKITPNNSRQKSFSFAKQLRPGTSKSLTKHKSTAASLKKRTDISVDNMTSGDQTDDMIRSHYTSTTSQDNVRTNVPQPEQHTNRSVFQPITNNSTRYLSKEGVSNSTSQTSGIVKKQGVITLVNSEQPQERRRKNERKVTVESASGCQNSSQAPPPGLAIQMAAKNSRHQLMLQKQLSNGNLHERPSIPSARSPIKSNLKYGLVRVESKAPSGFQTIKDSMDTALLSEIDLLKHANSAISEKYLSLNSGITTENQLLRHQISQMTQATSETLQRDTIDFKTQCAEWKAIVEDMGRMTLPSTTSQKESRLTQSQLQEQEQSFIEASDNFERALKAKDTVIKKLTESLINKTDTVRDLQEELTNLKTKYDGQEQRYEAAKSQVETLQAQNMTLSAKVKCTSTFKQLLKGLKNELETQQSAFDEQTELFNAKEREFGDLKRRVAEQLGKLAQRDSQIVSLKGGLERATSEISEKEVKIKIFEEDNIKLTARLGQLESTDRMNSNYKQEVTMMEQQHQRNLELLDSLKRQLSESKAALQVNLEEMKLFRDRDAEFEKMIEYWNELHKINFKYISQREDPIDAKLAEFINKADPQKRMKCLFVREGNNGHYNYFTKKVIMKVENNNLILRVGGGFMSIDEFIEQHNPIAKHIRQQGTAHPFQSSMQQLPHISSQKNLNWTNRKHSYDGTSMRGQHQTSARDLQPEGVMSRQLGQTQRTSEGAHSSTAGLAVKKNYMTLQQHQNVLSPVASISGRGFPANPLCNSAKQYQRKA